MTSLDRPLRRRQFLLGPMRPPDMTGWQRVSMGPDWLLEAHPDLPVVQCREGTRELTLLGYLLDPDEPARVDADILSQLARVAALDQLPAASARLGGRWAIVARQDGRAMLFTDPAGLRQVHHARTAGGETWCASQAGLLARVLGRSIDPEASEFAGSLYFSSHREPWWPGDSTLYRDIRRLTPNHALELTSAETHRFWPVEPLRPMSLSDASRACATTLTGLLHAAATRGPLAIGLTAGWDSRMVVAAARDVRPVPWCYTIEDPRADGNRRDVRTAARLAARLGMAHRAIRAIDHPDPTFGSACEGAVDTPHRYCGRHAAALSRHVPDGTLWVGGNCSEIARLAYRTHVPGLAATAEGIAAAAGMQRSTWAIRAIGRWLDEASVPAARFGYDVLDLYYWEVQQGSWLANGLAEWDIAVETLAPFDCRALLESLLGVDPAERAAPDVRLYRRVMTDLWPEALIEPINAVDRRTRLRAAARRAALGMLHRTHTHDLLMTGYLEARRRTLQR